MFRDVFYFHFHVPHFHQPHFHLSLSNINYLGAIVFTLGCCVLTTNAVLSFLPYIGPDFKLPPEIIYVEGALSLISNALFLSGSAFAFMQIVNAKRAELYEESKSRFAVSEEDMGLKEKTEKPVVSVSHAETAGMTSSDEPASPKDSVISEADYVKQDEKPAPPMGIYISTPYASTDNLTAGLPAYAEEAEDTQRLSPQTGLYLTTPYSSTDNLSLPAYSEQAEDAEKLFAPMGIYASTPYASTDDLTAGLPAPDEEAKDLEAQTETPYVPLPEEAWRYVPSSHEMWVRTIHEIGFLATTIFFCSSLLYFSSSIASIVEIVRTGEISRWVRYPQLIAAVGFAIASIILMMQAQDHWWQPAWHRLRWYVNLLNLIGSAGFIFCAVFGLIEDASWARYQFGMSYLWGSWAFLFGSMMQWYKSFGKTRTKRAKAGFDEKGEVDLML